MARWAFGVGLGAALWAGAAASACTGHAPAAAAMLNELISQHFGNEVVGNMQSDDWGPGRLTARASDTINGVRLEFQPRGGGATQAIAFNGRGWDWTGSIFATEFATGARGQAETQDWHVANTWQYILTSFSERNSDPVRDDRTRTADPDQGDLGEFNG